MLLSIEESISNLKLIVCEVEGVVTDGLIPYDEMGNVPFKNFSHKDLEAVNKLRTDYKFVFVSKYGEINYSFFRRKNIPFYIMDKNSLSTIHKIAEKYSVTYDEILYIGSNHSDFTVMRAIPFSMCPSDAALDIQQIAALKLNSPGGNGPLCDAVSFINRREYANKERS